MRLHWMKTLRARGTGCCRVPDPGRRSATMEKRFTVKDFFLFAAIGGVLVALLITMYMIDRQWNMMSRMRATMQEQSEDLRALRADLKALDERVASGVVAARAAEADSEPAVAAAFERALAATRRPGYASGDWLVRAFGVGLKTITPLVSQDAYASDVQGYVQETLIARNPDTLEWEGLIARSWDISEDGLTITFRLRDGVNFSDGRPLTADDVAFTFAFIMNESIAAPRYRAYLEKIETVEATSTLEVRFQYREPYFNALALAGGLEVMPRHFYEPYLEDPTTFNESKGLLLGSGPYRLADPKAWTPDLGLVELERNPRYWGPVAPSFDRILWKVIENDSARLTTFRNRDIDSYGARPREYQGLLDDEALRAQTHNFEFMNAVAGYSYIGWNQRRNGEPTRFADRRVRQAMTWLTDRERVIEEIMLGYAEPAVSPFSPRSRQHDSAIEARTFDPEKAKALLAEAGYRDRDGDGVLEDEAGAPFEFELVYFQESEDTERIVLFLKDLYARAGVHLKPLPTEWPVMLDLMNERNYDAITLGWTSGVETDVFQMFHGSQTEDGGDNFIHFKHAEFDALVDRARATVREEERMPLWQAVERIFHEEQPYTFLMRRKTLAFVDRRLENLEVTKLGLNLSSVPVEIFTPSAEQRYTD